MALWEILWIMIIHVLIIQSLIEHFVGMESIVIRLISLKLMLNIAVLLFTLKKAFPLWWNRGINFLDFSLKLFFFIFLLLLLFIWIYAIGKFFQLAQMKTALTITWFSSSLLGMRKIVNVAWRQILFGFFFSEIVLA